MSGAPGAPTETELRTADGLRLAARWRRGRGGGEGAVVLVHGFSSSQRAPAVEALAARLAGAGRAVLTFDLRGHGASEGECTLGWTERLDVDAAVAAARTDHEVVVAVGTSLGGIAVVDHLAAGAEAGAAGEADAAVVVATPAIWRVPRSPAGAMAVFVTQTGPGRSLLARRTGTRLAVRSPRGAAPVERIRFVRRPVAVVHGLDDRFIRADAARALYAAAPGPRRLDLVPGMGHGYSAAGRPAVEAAVAWAASRAADRPG